MCQVINLKEIVYEKAKVKLTVVGDPYLHPGWHAIRDTELVLDVGIVLYRRPRQYICVPSAPSQAHFPALDTRHWVPMTNNNTVVDTCPFSCIPNRLLRPRYLTLVPCRENNNAP